MQLVAYLSFDGQAREAMAFYAGVFSGRVTHCVTYGDSPMRDEMGADYRERILHAQVEAAGALLMGADGPPPHAAGGTTVNVVVDAPDEAERIFHALADGGQVHLAIEETFWAQRFGALQDRYGKRWRVNCPRPMRARPPEW